MAKYYSETQAIRKFGKNYSRYGNIHISGSLRGMRDKYGWDLKTVIRVGSYYYHLRGHPKMKSKRTKKR